MNSYIRIELVSLFVDSLMRTQELAAQQNVHVAVKNGNTLNQKIN